MTVKRTFTKYPSRYVKASEEISSGLFDRLVDTYVETDLGYSDIVSKLENRYGVDNAKDVAAVVCRNRRQREAEADSWNRWCDSHSGYC